jgi:glucosamine kinase
MFAGGISHYAERLAIYLGIDGGGSKTSCLIGDEHSIFGEGLAGGSNVVRVGEEKARQSLSEGIHQACRAAAVLPSQIKRTCIGIAGAAQPQIAEVVHQLLAEIVSGEIKIVGDMVIALHAAFDGGPGVIVTAGTGSIAYGCNAEGRTARAGGWGFAVSDEGSGHWIGRNAVTAILRAADEGLAVDKSLLCAAIMKCWALRTQQDIVLAANAFPLRDFAGLFPVVQETADEDPVAHDVLTRAGKELASLGGLVLRRIFSTTSQVPVAMSGGVFANSGVVRDAFREGLRAYPNAVLGGMVAEPARAALALARKE